MSYMDELNFWLNDDYFDQKTKDELLAIRNNEAEVEDRFYKELEFGTGGLRGVIGAGTNRMNVYTVRKATQGLANYIIKRGTQSKGVAIAFDSRRMSPEFSDEAARCLAANGIKAYIFESLRPTPELSFALRTLGCTAGIVVTASHNPPEYNGYKVYWEDGAQVTAPIDKDIITELSAEKEELEEKETQLKDEQEKLEQANEALEENKSSLSKKISAASAQIEDISLLEKQYQSDLAASQQKAKEMEQEIAAAYASIANLSSSTNSEYVGGEMKWPLPNYSTISSSYGWRFNGTDFHTGIDITGSNCMGATIVAANTGTVVKANTTFTVGRGYGKYIIIDHGGGKSTLCQLVPRFYDVTEGSIRVDGLDVRQVTQRSLRRAIGIVQQDVFLFADTIRENIRYGRPDATDEEVEQAAYRAELLEDIRTMPQGFDTYVGERGAMLSGGQKQRVAIARIFLKDPAILILDEATSALDSVTESKIQGAFDQLSQGRTTLIIAHRLSTIRSAHRILVVQDGRIAEQGSHAQLLAENGAYARLYHTQNLGENHG